MKRIIKKFKKLKSIYKVMFLVISILFLFSIIFISQGVLLLKNIETVLRIIFLILIYIGYFIYLFISILLLFSKKNKSFIINSIFITLISTIFIIISIYLNKTYNIIDNMNKDKVTYSSSLVIMKDSEFKNSNDFVVGMINDEADVEGNILANKLIEKKKLDKIELKYYDNYLEMLSDLYNKVINGLFISSNYVLSYSSYDNYNNLSSDTKVIYSYKEEMKNQDIQLTTNKSLTEPFTILLLGVDSTKDGLKTNSAFNGDTMMMITFNPKTLNATIFSVPRDTYVPIACNGNKSNKINSSAAGGTSCVINTLENLTGIDIDYYVKINFKGVVDLVDAIDGVSVDVPIDFCEQDSNRDFENQICLKKGVQTLNGEQALALARHRKTLAMGDFQRVQHQQLVVESILNKAKNIRNVTMLFDILNVISNNIETNISTDEILNLYNVGKKMLLNNNANINIEKTYLTGYDLTMLIPGLGNVYTFQYYEQSLEEIVNAMKLNLGLIKPKLTKTFNFSANYTYEVPVIGKKYYTVTRNEALPSFVDSNLNYLNNWATSRNIEVKVNYIKDGMDGYDETKDNIIISQDVLKGTLVSTINSISVNVIKVEKTNINNENVNVENNEINNNLNTENNNVEDNTNEDEIIVNENDTTLDSDNIEDSSQSFDNDNVIN
ncbi:MAG: LCP family protein [Bacilli bacterium]|nr:LCP family protein [Bacilli bacterium]